MFYHIIKSKKLFAYQRDMPDTSCLFKVWKNAAMMAKVICKLKSGHPLNSHDIAKKYSSDSDNPKCIKNVCETCEPAKVMGCWFSVIVKWNRCKWIGDDDESDYISLTMWICKDKKIKKWLNAWSRKNPIMIGNKWLSTLRNTFTESEYRLLHIIQIKQL